MNHVASLAHSAPLWLAWQQLGGPRGAACALATPVTCTCTCCVVP